MLFAFRVGTQASEGPVGEFILRRARDKRVIDLGFVDHGHMLAKTDGTWLRTELKRVARLDVARTP
jgi:hypothetical protein